MIRDAGLQPGRGADTRTRLKTRGRGDTPNIWSRLTSPAQPSPAQPSPAQPSPAQPSQSDLSQNVKPGLGSNGPHKKV